MPKTRTEPFSDQWVWPLLDLANSDPAPEVRLAALRAAAHFPLGQRAWQQLAVAGWRLVAETPGGSPVRRAALGLAARLPLPSVRNKLRQMAANPAEPDRDAIAAAMKMAPHASSRLRAPPPGDHHPEFRPFGPVEFPEVFKVHASVTGLLLALLQQEKTGLHDDQVAWKIASKASRDLIREVVALVRGNWPPETRRRLLDILGQAADCQAGRAATRFWDYDGGAEPPPDPIVDAPSVHARSRGSSSRAADQAASPPRMAPASATVPARPRGAPSVSISRGGATQHPPGAEPAAVASATTTTQDERHVRARIIHEGQPRNTFVAGASNIIRCWIGLPEDDGAATADAPIQTVAIPKEGLLLTVELCWGDQRDSSTMLLPAPRSARSGDCDLHVDVPAEERYVKAEIMFRYRGRCFETVLVEAAALAPGEEAGPRDALRIRAQLSRREVIAVADARPCTSTLTFGNSSEPGSDHAAGVSGGQPTLRVYDGTGGRNFTLKSPGKAIEALNTVLFSTQKSLVRRLAPAPGAEALLDAGDEEVRILLRNMARFGAGLFNQLEQQGFADPGERIQLLSLDPDVVLPLEFVYDRGYPIDAAHLCKGWQAALEADARVCPACGHDPLSADARRHAATICPLGFWSLRKVIERLNPAGAENASAPGANRRSLPAIDSAVFASSNKVPEDERTATWKTIHECIGNATLARDWDEWYDAVKQHPRLLIALPHHDEEELEDFLEIGDESLGHDLARLRRGQIRPEYVNPDGCEPGPILLLLGCRTGAESELGYVQVVREFQKLKTAIVLGTLAQILGRHAAPLARELVTQLVAVDDANADFGTLMRRVRRRMLARGYLLALCLVALGDAEWRLTPLPRASEPAATPT